MARASTELVRTAKNLALAERQLAETQGKCDVLEYALFHLSALVRECCSTPTMYDERRKRCLECADDALGDA